MPISNIQLGSERPATEAIGLAVVLMLAGFALADGYAGAWISNVVSTALAMASGLILWPFGLDLVRDGVELRSVSGGWAIRVSDVCDGIGLFVAFVAIATTLHWTSTGARTQSLARHLLIGFLAIQAFNLARVTVLALVLRYVPDQFALVHTSVFPFLTVMLVSWLFLSSRQVWVFWALAVGVSVIWPLIASAFAAALVPVANALLWLVAPTGIGTIARAGEIWAVETNFLAGLDPLQLYSAPIVPVEFVLALPIVAAAIVLTRSYWTIAVVLVATVLALSCGALTVSWALTEAHSPIQVLQSDGAGAFFPADYALPTIKRALVAVLQNTLVHLNYLVLPILMLARQGHPNA